MAPVVLCCAVSLSAVTVAHAQTPAVPSAAATPSASQAAPAPATPSVPDAGAASAAAPAAGSFDAAQLGGPLVSLKRPVPDYDGRGPREVSAGESLLWVPRVVFFPVFLVTEYVLRWPLGVLTVAAERGRWIETLTDFVKFGPDKKMTAFPTALIDFGFRSSVGAYFSWDDAGAKGNSFRLHAATGGPDWLRLTAGYTARVSDSTQIKLRAEGWRRPDGVFFGLGPSSRVANESRYASDTVAAGLAIENRPARGVTAIARTSARAVDFPRTDCCDDPTLRERIAEGALPSPPGFPRGFTTVRQALDLALDSRAPRPAAGSGVRLELHGDLAFDARSAVTTRWAGYGGSVAGFVDLTGHNRVLSLQVMARFADPLGKGEIPFLELPTLGGDGPMRGFVPGRLYGRSAAVAKLEYRYPVWAFLDATAQVALGNVFGEHLDGLSPEKLRTAFAFGFRTIGERDQSFDVLVGAGSETFEQGARLNSVRLVFGATTGF